MKTPELKPCPFCGMPVHQTEIFIGTMYMDDFSGFYRQDFRAKIECRCGLTYECEWTEPPFVGSKQCDIVTAWNRRAKDESK